ncbi:Protoheme IX farnesyltransferase [Phycisphaerae bacterium RAS1]|nr:Protoheme IX farnesyltransferase [Phycisphaerae bacterium RAS1]
MSQNTLPAAVAGPVRLSARSFAAALADLLDLSKARLSSLVLFTTAIGFTLAAPGPIEWHRLAAVLIGTALTAFGANALNQWIEADRDARMHRTRNRPLPAGRISSAQALCFAALTGMAGPLILAWFVNLLTGLLGLFTLAAYVLVYTPLKTRTPLNTLVGAVVGAIPPVMGWTAATGRVGVAAVVLFGILLIWQMPHFMALAWLYREDYARGGFKMLPVVDPHGRLTAAVAVSHAFLLIPIAAALWALGVCGAAYGVGSILLGAAFAWLALRLWRRRSDAAARQLFFGSVIYLPLLLILMAADQA